MTKVIYIQKVGGGIITIKNDKVIRESYSDPGIPWYIADNNNPPADTTILVNDDSGPCSYVNC